MEELSQDYLASILRKRPTEAHKGVCGHVLVIAGSKGMVGAALLTAVGALRSGAGLVKISIEEKFFPIIQSALPEAICIDRRLGLRDLDQFQVVAIGPGMGLAPNNKLLLETALETSRPTIILDADALSLLKFIGEKKSLKSAAAQRKSLIITPHPGEGARLLDTDAETINKNRSKYGRKLVESYGAISLLKGFETIITDVSGKQYMNTSGNPGMATAGSGDVLTGIVAGFAAQGYSPLEAGLLGVYVHGGAGDMAAEALGQHGLIASDIASMVGLVIKEIMTAD